MLFLFLFSHIFPPSGLIPTLNFQYLLLEEVGLLLLSLLSIHAAVRLLHVYLVLLDCHAHLPGLSLQMIVILLSSVIIIALLILEKLGWSASDWSGSALSWSNPDHSLELIIQFRLI